MQLVTLGAVTRDGVRVVTADTVSITGARRQQLDNEASTPESIRRTRFSLPSSAATGKVGVAPSSRPNKIGQVPRQKVSSNAEAAKPVDHAA
jgi:hypothetical protein